MQIIAYLVPSRSFSEGAVSRRRQAEEGREAARLQQRWRWLEKKETLRERCRWRYAGVGCRCVEMWRRCQGEKKFWLGFRAGRV
uniref:Uncharacterized protein n=1 Tax=Cucumis melo TaxID=3656 RepID=A0A9I9E5E1_CUCME